MEPVNSLKFKSKKRRLDMDARAAATGSVPAIKLELRFSVSRFVRLPKELGKASGTDSNSSSTPMKLVKASKYTAQTMAGYSKVRILT